MSAEELENPLSQQDLSRFKTRLSSLSTVRRIGYVQEIVVTTVRANLPDVMQSELCEIETIRGEPILGEVIAFDENTATISCLQSVRGVALGARVRPLGAPHSIKAEDEQMSSVLDGMGRNIDDPNDFRKGVISTDYDASPVMRQAPSANTRPPIDESLVTQVKVIDSILTLGKGQRIGIFAPPGCGKSTLMAQIVRGAQVDAVVFGLVGERGRELREFMEREIDDGIRAKSFFVCATSDKSPIERVRAAFTATSIAEYLCAQGKSVLLVIDSLTRLARAQRELGLMAGEPTTQSGFTPSVFSIMPELIERSGRTERGTITAIYTVLLESDRIEDDPIASEAKSLLDAHILLSTKLVERHHFPAIDTLKSLSRVMGHVAGQQTKSAALCLRRAYSLYQEVELLIRLNEYKAGSDAMVDEVVRIKPELDNWCQQDRFAPVSPQEAVRDLEVIVANLSNLMSKA